MSESEKLLRTSAFSYQCNRCMACCRNNHITLDPYAVTRLARRLHIGTTEFLARYTIEGGVVLRSQDNGDCPFLGDWACNVYDDRPLVCRTYPLHRLKNGDSDEFDSYVPRPETKGVYGSDGTVNDYLRTQDIGRHAAASDRYFDLVGRIAQALGQAIRATPDLMQPVRETLRLHYECRADNVPPMLDVDRVMADYCRALKIDSPTDPEDSVSLHIRVIDERLEAFASVDGDARKTEALELAALAGAIGIPTRARAELMLIAGVLGKPPS